MINYTSKSVSFVAPFLTSKGDRIGMANVVGGGGGEG